MTSRGKIPPVELLFRAYGQIERILRWKWEELGESDRKRFAELHADLQKLYERYSTE